MAHYLATLPAFLLWWSTGLALVIAFAALYVLITPQHELQLIRSGNLSVSICFCGALLGIALPVSSAIAHGVDLIDLSLWGLVALIAQLGVYGLLRLALRDLTAQLIGDNRALALLVATVCIVAGLLAAAAMTY